MKIKGLVEFNNNITLTQKAIDIDTSIPFEIEHEVCDAIAFALYGKTVYKDVPNTEFGVPFVSLNLECNGKIANIARQPEYVRKTNLGTTYLTKELFSIKAESFEYDSLSCENYYNLIKDYVDISFDEFVSIFKF